MSDIAALRKADASEAKKEAEQASKLNRATILASRAGSASTLQSKLNECERAQKNLAAIQKKRADIGGKIANKSKSLHAYEERQTREDSNAQKKMIQEQKKLIRERENHERKISLELRGRAEMISSKIPEIPDSEGYDFFISHASEDKDSFVRSLSDALSSKGAKVWYDELTLQVGDSLRRNIDKGLSSSQFGVVVLSESFFRKEWPNRELDGLVALEVQGQSRILPIWHKVSKEEVSSYSPSLADKVALNTSIMNVDEIADKLMNLIQ